LSLGACSDDDPTAPPETGNVRVEASLTANSVPFGKAVAEAESAQGGTVDSIRDQALQKRRNG
jgi:hypothetical protein